MQRGNGARANSGADHMKNHPENNIHLDDNKEMLCSLGAPTTCLENDCLDNGSISDDSRPLKKTKSQADKIDSSPKTSNDMLDNLCSMILSFEISTPE